MQLHPLFLVATFAFASPAAAQADFDFLIDQSRSNFTWSGQTNYGPIVGNPSNAFQLAGSSVVSLAPNGSDPVATGAFTGGGDAAVIPDLHGRVVGPFGITLATIDVTNLHLAFSTPGYAIDAAGAFTSTLTITALSGTMTITPTGGSPSASNLAGQTSSPASQSGTLSINGASLHLTMPVNATFAFSDPSSGASGTIDVVGTMIADWTSPPAAVYCTAKINSLGCVPAIASAGTASYTSASAFTISAANVLSQKNGLLFYGFAASAAPFQGGIKCVAPPTVRTLVQGSGGSVTGDDCTGTFSFDFNAHVQSFADPQLVPGRDVFGQYWSRDPGSGSTTNLTDAVGFTIGI